MDLGEDRSLDDLPRDRRGEPGLSIERIAPHPAGSARIRLMRCALRELRDEDLAVLFEQWADPVAVRMGAFTALDHMDRARIRAPLVQARSRRERDRPSDRLRRGRRWNDWVVG